MLCQVMAEQRSKLNKIFDICVDAEESTDFTLLSRSSSFRNQSNSEYRRRTVHSFNRKTGKLV